MFDAFYAGISNLLMYGCAGTGKSFCALYLALKEILNPNTPYHKVYIVRSAVSSRDLGFMPGKLNEKLQVYEPPYIKMVNDLFGRGDAYQIATTKGVLEIISTSFLRGMTYDNCIMIVDEIQNMNYEEQKTVITRAGDNCKILFCGDVEQNDLYRSKYDTSGMFDFMKVIDLMESFEMIEFLPEDIVRSGLCREFILAERQMAQNKIETV